MLSAVASCKPSAVCEAGNEASAPAHRRLIAAREGGQWLVAGGQAPSRGNRGALALRTVREVRARVREPGFLYTVTANQI